MLYRPFADNLQEVPPEDLIRLKDVHEGWYAEYKGELIANRELAKSLSSFANQYGGLRWTPSVGQYWSNVK